jgi:hypothetical protein
VREGERKRGKIESKKERERERERESQIHFPHFLHHHYTTKLVIERGREILQYREVSRERERQREGRRSYT